MIEKTTQNDKPNFRYYTFSLILFFCSIIFGYLFSRDNPEYIQDFKRTYQSLSGINDFPSYFLLLFIFLNNTIKMFFVLFFSFFFGIAPLYFTVVNGFTIGVVILALQKVAGYPTLIAGLLPHGIFEISALIIVLSYSFWLSLKFIGSIRRTNQFIPYLVNSIKFFAKVIVPILAVAALIETYATPYLINLTIK